MARTPLFESLVRLARQARPAAGRPFSRRSFLRRAAATGLVLAGCGSEGEPPPEGESPATRPPPTGPRVAVVGGGLAGLVCADRLVAAGVAATLYEAAPRPGGRILTAHETLAPGLVTELGGEFINTEHRRLLALAGELGLEVVDRRAAVDPSLAVETYFLDGRTIGSAEVVEALRPFVERIEADAKAVDDDDAFARRIDALDVASYLDRLGLTGWLRRLLDVAMVTEMGLETAEQTALNLLWLLPTDLGDDWETVEGDERYRIAGGNDRVPIALADRLGNRFVPGHRLESLRPAASGFRLSFQGPNRTAVEVAADRVVLAMPFSVLRTIELAVELPAGKRQAIDELGYGTNAKVLLGLDRPVWEGHGSAGMVFTDLPFQLAWDHGRGADGAAGLTFFLGGEAGVRAGRGRLADTARDLATGLEQAWPGVLAARNGKVDRWDWPAYALSRGSYACYRPGQATSFGGTEGQAVGAIHFAGEHTSDEYQGYMEGGVESGLRAAAEVRAAVGA